jgi:hypothetical protein
MNPIAKAGYFGILFDTILKYNGIVGLGIPKSTASLELNRLFIEKIMT